MLKALSLFFSAPVHKDIELSQKLRFLHIVLVLSFAATLILGIQNLGGESNLEYLLFLVSLISLMCIPLNKRGYYNQVALFIYVLLLALIPYTMIVGVGLMDAGMLAYPVFIIISAFLFNVRIAMLSTVLSIGSIYLVYLRETQGQPSSVEWSPDTQFVVISTLLVVAGVSVIIITQNWKIILENLFQAYDSTLEGWAKALELRDKETEGHSQRVTSMGLRVARIMGMSRDQLHQFRRGALLHDIGKMAIPDEILLKPGALTTGERSLIEEHPLQAKKMLEGIPFLQQALEIPICHHERWDGSGYPRNLVGEQIPLSARIFAIVDVWDALTSDRPYRKAWTENAAFIYICENRGILFDPKCVDAFIELLEVKKHKG